MKQNNLYSSGFQPDWDLDSYLPVVDLKRDDTNKYSTKHVDPKDKRSVPRKAETKHTPPSELARQRHHTLMSSAKLQKPKAKTK